MSFQLLEYQMGGGRLYLILQGNWYLPTRAEGNTPHPPSRGMGALARGGEGDQASASHPPTRGLQTLARGGEGRKFPPLIPLARAPSPRARE